MDTVTASSSSYSHNINTFEPPLCDMALEESSEYEWTDNKSSMHISELPDSLLLHIFNFMDFTSVCQVCQVCKRWSRISTDELLWRSVFLNHFKLPLGTTLPKKAVSWRSEFKRLFYHTPALLADEKRDHKDEVLHVSFSNDGSMFATCSKDGHFMLWSAREFPVRLLFDIDMKSRFRWRYTQFSQFNETDTRILVSGVLWLSYTTEGEIVIFNLQDMTMELKSQVTNKPYDVFGAWYNNDYFLSGTLEYLGGLRSTSSIWLRQADTIENSEASGSVVYRFENVNSSSVRLINVAETQRAKLEDCVDLGQVKRKAGKPSCCHCCYKCRKFQCSANRHRLEHAADSNQVSQALMEVNGVGTTPKVLSLPEMRKTTEGETQGDERDIEQFGVNMHGQAFDAVKSQLNQSFNASDVSSDFCASAESTLNYLDLSDSVTSQISCSTSSNSINNNIDRYKDPHLPHPSLSDSMCWSTYKKYPCHNPQSKPPRVPSDSPSSENFSALTLSTCPLNSSVSDCVTSSGDSEESTLISDSSPLLLHTSLGNESQSKTEQDSHLTLPHSSEDTCNSIQQPSAAEDSKYFLCEFQQECKGSDEQQGCGDSHFDSFTSGNCDAFKDSRETCSGDMNDTDLGNSLQALNSLNFGTGENLFLYCRDIKSGCGEGDEPVQSLEKYFVHEGSQSSYEACSKSDLCDSGTQTPSFSITAASRVVSPSSQVHKISQDIQPCKRSGFTQYDPTRRTQEAAICTSHGADFYCESKKKTSAILDPHDTCCKESKTCSRHEVEAEKLLVYTWGYKSFTPHIVGFKRMRWTDVFQESPQTCTPDHSIEMNGHIVGLRISPDQKFLYINCRAWPSDYFISDPSDSPPVAQEVEVRTVDLETFEFVGPILRSHKAFTPSEDCFFLHLDVSEDYVVSGAEDKHGHLWDRHYGIQLCKFPHNSVVNCVAMNPRDSEMAVTVSDDFNIRVWLSRHKQKLEAAKGNLISDIPQI